VAQTPNLWEAIGLLVPGSCVSSTEHGVGTGVLAHRTRSKVFQEMQEASGAAVPAAPLRMYGFVSYESGEWELVTHS
jgi:hypothetical protein